MTDLADKWLKRRQKCIKRIANNVKQERLELMRKNILTPNFNADRELMLIEDTLRNLAERIGGINGTKT